MSVDAIPAIYFECEECDHKQYTDNTLEYHLVRWADNIDCEKCGHTNYVVMEKTQ